MSLNILENACNDELDAWFNEVDENNMEVINKDVIVQPLDHITDPEPGLLDNPKCMESVENTKCVCVDDILKIDPETSSSYELIQYECSIAYFVQVLLEGSTFVNKIKSPKVHENELTYEKINSIIEYLSWISHSSEVLASRIKQELVFQDVSEDVPLIVRSSYNFCVQYAQCKSFYNKYETPSCREHHYVHSLLKFDVDSVINFLKYVIEKKYEITKDELNNLYLSIKTICFVTRHMAKEISYVDYITKNNSEKFHRNNPFEISKKKNIIKKHTPLAHPYPVINPQKEKSTNKEKESIQDVKTSKKIRGGFRKMSGIKINKPNIGDNRFSILLDE